MKSVAAFALSIVGLLLLPGCMEDDAVASETTPDTSAVERTAVEIFVNQVGFAPGSQKIAILHSDSENPLKWVLYNSDNQPVMQGLTVPLGFSERAERGLHRIEFSAYQTAGHGYRIGVEATLSPDFDIRPDLYTEIAREAGRYFYHNRAGEPIGAEHVGDSHARPAGHESEVVTCFDGVDRWDTQWEGCPYSLDVTGGWYDAGDHGKYVVNAGISTWTLLDAYEYLGDACGDSCLNIPESGNGVSDILDEARKSIEFMMSMQIPEGERVWVTRSEQETDQPLEIEQIDAGGLVHHKVHDETWAGTVRPDENDRTRYLYPPSTGATLNVAAIAERCARIWETIDSVFSSQCAEVANDAFQAAKAYPDIFAYNNFDGGGPYGDSWLYDEFAWATAEREKSGRDLSFSEQSDKFHVEVDVPRVPGFNAVDALALLGGDAEETAQWLKLADAMLAETQSEPLHIPFASDTYNWGSNGGLANRGMILGHAYLLTGEEKYRDGVVDIMDYFLGRNPMGVSYVTGFGDRPFENPHHRHWSHSVRDGAPKPPPGVLSGGPNNSNMSDPVAETMVGTCAAQTCWRDDYEAWTQNEVTINWNAPFFWMALFLDATEP